MQADLVGISLACEPGAGYYIPVGHKTNGAQLGLDVLRKALQELGEGIGYGEGERGGKVPFTQSGK